MAELLESVLTLYMGRLMALQIEVSRKIGRDVELYCFSGELRQVFANLIGNAIDAMSLGGRLSLSLRRSRSWVDGTPGFRLFVADNGCGMTAGHASADLSSPSLPPRNRPEPGLVFG